MRMQAPADTAVKPRQQPIILALAAVWILLTLAGLWGLLQYANTPGAPRDVVEQWPAGTKVERNPLGATLVMFAHPQCPCTRASLEELNRIVAQTGGIVKPRVVFFKPRAAEENWEQTDLWRSAAAIPGCLVSSDLDGEEARRFHATTSGHALLYDAAGKLLFSGGITAARGHEGDNAGQNAIVSLLTEGTAERRESPVFGCPIVTDSTSQGETP